MAIKLKVVVYDEKRIRKWSEYTLVYHTKDNFVTVKTYYRTDTLSEFNVVIIVK